MPILAKKKDFEIQNFQNFQNFQKNCISALKEKVENDCRNKNEGNLDKDADFSGRLMVMSQTDSLNNGDKVLVRLTAFNDCYEWQKYLLVSLNLDDETCEIDTEENQLCMFEAKQYGPGKGNRRLTGGCPRGNKIWGDGGDDKECVNDYWFATKEKNFKKVLKHISTNLIPARCSGQKLKYLAQCCETNGLKNFVFNNPAHELTATYGNYDDGSSPKSEYGTYDGEEGIKEQIIVHGTTNNQNPPVELDRSIWWGDSLDDPDSWELRCGNPCGTSKDYTEATCSLTAP